MTSPFVLYKNGTPNSPYLAGSPLLYRSACMSTFCGPSGFAEIFALPTNTSASGQLSTPHFLNFTFSLTWGAGGASSITTQVNTISTTGPNTYVYFYIVFGSGLPSTGVTGFNILVSQSR